MLQNQTRENFDQLLKEAFNHLKEGRGRLALSIAKKVYEKKQGDPESLYCLAWANLENNDLVSALEYADMAVNINDNSPLPRLYRAYILIRSAIYENALIDIDYVINNSTEDLGWAFELKAVCMGGLGKHQEALKNLESALKLKPELLEKKPKIREWYKNAAGIKNSFLSKLREKEDPLYVQAEEALKVQEYWYTLWASRKIIEDPKEAEYKYAAFILEIRTLIELFQLKTAREKLEEFNKVYPSDQHGEELAQALKLKSVSEDSSPEESRKTNPVSAPKPPVSSGGVKPVSLDALLDDDEDTPVVRKGSLDSFLDEKPSAPAESSGNFSKFTRLDADMDEETEKKPAPQPFGKRTDFAPNPDSSLKVYLARTFDFLLHYESGKKLYYFQFNYRDIRYVGVELSIHNPYYQRDSMQVAGQVIWYLNSIVVGNHTFSTVFEAEDKIVTISQSWGTQSPGFWRTGQGKAEIYLFNQKIGEKWFLIGDTPIYDLEEIDLNELDSPGGGVKSGSAESEEDKIAEILKELNKFTGLGSVKNKMREFVDYLRFIQERKKSGFKTKDGLSVNSAFLGNPGTGKTSVARVIGDIFKAMGILEKGHIVEVDRAALVGQYVGETAQKTETKIEEAMGGVLFIDEAYTLVKKGVANDFGQEAIDTLLKRMEDKAGQFAVIVAGYPNEMNDFFESNPGMKSRFTHMFDFEDYTPEEMIEIFTGMAGKEDYKITDDAKTLLQKEFEGLYRRRDKTFGNARLVRNIFDDAKMQLSKRYLKLSPAERTNDALVTIVEPDIVEVFKKDIKKHFRVGVDEEKLETTLAKLNGLLGLTSVKKEINELVKLARFFAERGEDIQSRFSDHVVFLGNPGTGKTTVARLFSEIYAALGILPKGHLVETDRQNMVASYVGKTAEKTTELINSSIGGTLFIDEAYTLVKAGDSGSDFGKEAIDTLLKRMEDDRGKFIVIAAGYTEDMQRFLESNPGLQSRFTKFITFEDYNPEELMQISENLLKGKDLRLSDDAREKLMTYYNEKYRGRDKTFANARFVRNTVDAAVRKQLLRVVDFDEEKRNSEDAKIVEAIDFDEISKSREEKRAFKVTGNPEILEKKLAELNSLTGLGDVKRAVEKLISSLKIARLREERGLTVIRKSLHSVFLGNPGTGKTTVARLLSEIFKEMGILEKGHLIEVDRSSLVAGYVGQTAQKTEEVIKQALGGTLFIDEAYTLNRGGSDFGQEAIDTLLKRMEDFKESLIVIVAGYPNEMKAFLESNPGLGSRFTNYFNFEDYNPIEMLTIARGQSEKSGYKLDETALEELLNVFSKLYENRDINFGNARTVRNILYKAIGNQEERILTLTNLSDDDLVKITADDVKNIDV
ncbi:MAG: AAA family ATPase [Ignavibacteriaceae bacterium]|nr:AAA family ATPase [Ignavibacteriaceae bacterium]